MDQFTVEVRRGVGFLTLSLTGELDMSTVGSLRACLDEIDADVRTVTIDMRGLTFIDSSGLNLFVMTQKRFGPELRELLLANPQPSTRQVLETSGIDQFIPIVGARTERDPA